MTKLSTNQKLLKKALEFEKECQLKFIKHYPTYLKELEKYAELNGFYDFDEMIRELSND